MLAVIKDEVCIIHHVQDTNYAVIKSSRKHVDNLPGVLEYLVSRRLEGAERRMNFLLAELISYANLTTAHL